MKQHRLGILFGLLLMLILVAGCGTAKKGTVIGTKYYSPDVAETDATETETKEGMDENLYMILSNDMNSEQLIVKQLLSGRKQLFYYTLTTSFLDKYGKAASVAGFDAGRVVTLGERDSKGKLKKVQISDEVWEYEQVVRFEIDEERSIFKIADRKYFYDDSLLVVSDDKKITLGEIGESDELRIIGKEKEILSVAVTTGHGTIALKNTELFEGSFLQVGRKIFAEITEDLTIEVPEGIYTVTVANNGYGGSKEITVLRSNITVIDLDELKGEGPKKGKINFVFFDEDENTINANLKIDGETIDLSKAKELDYGIHTIKASAEGFDVFEKKLFVNSEQAEIKITLSKEGTKKETSPQSSTATNTNSETTKSDENTASSDREETKEENEQMVSDYLSTLTELLGNLYN